MPELWSRPVKAECEYPWVLQQYGDIDGLAWVIESGFLERLPNGDRLTLHSSLARTPEPNPLMCLFESHLPTFQATGLSNCRRRRLIIDRSGDQ